MSTILPNQVSQGGIRQTAMERLRTFENDPVLRRIKPKGRPLLFEDEGLEMGESTLHGTTVEILFYGLTFHLVQLPDFQVFSNLNLHYSDDDPTAYVSPDIMVVSPNQPVPENLSSFRIGQEGPAPVLVAEVLSFRTYQQGDLTQKPLLYADLGIEEYILVDVTGELLEQRLLLLRRQENGTWIDEQDQDGGVTSRLGFRVALEDDGQVRVVDGHTGKRYARPDEAQQAVDGRAAAEERLRALEAELARLRQQLSGGNH